MQSVLKILRGLLSLAFKACQSWAIASFLTLGFILLHPCSWHFIEQEFLGLHQSLTYYFANSVLKWNIPIIGYYSDMVRCPSWCFYLNFVDKCYGLDSIVSACLRSRLPTIPLLTTELCLGENIESSRPYVYLILGCARLEG